MIKNESISQVRISFERIQKKKTLLNFVCVRQRLKFKSIYHWDKCINNTYDSGREIKSQRVAI